jgi:hypothetical protein
MKFERIRSRFGSAHAIALLALFVGLFGTAYAATKINGKNIKNASIPGKKLKANTVTGAKVNESTLAGGTITGVNAAKLGGKLASDFQPSGAVLGGTGIPTEVSETMFAIPALGLQIETDNAATTLNQVVLRDLTGQSITVISGTGGGEANTITGNGTTTTLFGGIGDFGGGTGGLEWLIVSNGKAAVISCYFPDEAEVGFDYCQATTTDA